MPTIVLETLTFDRLRLVAGTLGVNESDAVSYLMDKLAHGEPDEDKEIGIYAVYRGSRVEAEYNMDTQAVRIISGPQELMHRTFYSPSAAATEVVKVLNPKVSPERSGWQFWKVGVTGKELRSIRR